MMEGESTNWQESTSLKEKASPNGLPVQLAELYISQLNIDFDT